MDFRSVQPSASWFHIKWNDARTDPIPAMQPVLAIPGVRFYPLVLEIPFTAFGLPEVAELCVELGVKAPASMLHKYSSVQIWEPARKPLAHQREVASRLLTTTRLLCADEMGLGKTGSAIQAAETVRRHIHHHTRPVIIFGPLRLRRTWERELREMGALDTPEDFCALESVSLDNTSWQPNARYYFVHFDVIHVWWTRLALMRPCMTIMDEAHLAKNGASKRTKSASLAFQGAPFRLMLTGTPVQNKPQDVWSLLNMLCGERTWGTAYDFRTRYCGAFRNDFGLQDGEPTNVDEFQARLRPFYIRRELSTSGVELPPFKRQILDVVPSRVTYDEYAARVASLSHAQAAEIVKVMLQGTLLQNAIRTIGKLRKVTSDAKLKATIELAESILAQDNAVVVFTWERRTADHLASKLGSRPALTGDLDISSREFYIEDFQANGGPLVATYGALAEGVTLHRARALILHDIDWVASTMLQAEKRIHRLRQNFACTVYWMTCTSLFDAFMLEALRVKLRDAELLMSLTQAVPEIARPEVDDFESRMARELAMWRATP